MADDEQYLLEDLEDEGEEVDYDELTLDDDFLDEDLEDGEEPAEDAKTGEELNFDEPPPEFEEATLEGGTAGISEVAHAATEAEEPAQETDLVQSTETAVDANKQDSAAGRRIPVAAPTVGKGSSAPGESAAPASSSAPAKPKKPETRGATAPQRGRAGPRSGRGQHGRGAQGRGPQGGGHIPQPLSRGPTPPPGPNGMNMPRPGPGMPGLPMPPGMMLPGPMMGTRPMQMMPRPMPMAAGQPRPPPGRGPAPSFHSPDRQRGRHVPIPAPQPPPPREPIHFPQMGMQGGTDRSGAPAVLPMPPMAHLMSQGSRLPHPQPPPPGPLGNRQDQRGHVAGHLMPNGIAVQPPQPANNMRGTANNFNLALGMDANSSVRNPQRNGTLGGRPGAGAVNVPQRLQGRLEEPAPLAGLLRPRDMAEELRQKEERQEAERAKARAKEAEEKKKAEALKAKKLEMAKLQIALQQAENRKNQLLRAAAERTQKQRELEDFEAMKLRVLQLEKMVAAAASTAPSKAPTGPVSVPIVSAPAAASEPPQKSAEMGDPHLHVNFDDDETEEEPSPQQPPAVPLAMRLQRASVTNKDVKVTPASHSRAIRSIVRPVESEKPAKEKRRRRSPVAMETEAEEAAPVEGYTDLREFLSRKKRTREGVAEDSRQTKAAVGHRRSDNR
ncbi:hypothetical protein COCOBI_03-2830 [Coccomyxa sp. Obi]|nr:hypothetical protein COCOBI_03-2830 [Coccomyxa sp. Obi]